MQLRRKTSRRSQYNSGRSRKRLAPDVLSRSDQNHEYSLNMILLDMGFKREDKVILRTRAVEERIQRVEDLIENLNEEAAKMTQTCKAIVDNDQRKDQNILELQGKVKKCNYALKATQETRASKDPIVEIMASLLDHRIKEAINRQIFREAYYCFYVILNEGVE